MQFVSFHTHSTYSYADGFGTVKEHVKRVVELGGSALALSEHGNVNSHVALEREAKAWKIKPIFGLEAYFGGVGAAKKQRKYHIGLYAMDEEGYRNLNAIVTQSYIDSYYYPTVSPQSLRKHSKGIVAFSGCADSFISCSLLGGKLLGEKRLSYTEDEYKLVGDKVEQFQEMFDGNFYLEVQRFPGLDRTRSLNPAFAQIAKEKGVPLIATADVHYPYPEQNEMQKLLHAARRQSTIALTEANWEYDILLTYPESDQQIISDLVGTGLSDDDAYGAVVNTQLLANQCNVELPKAKPLRFKTESSSARTALVDAVKAGWNERCEQRPDLRSRRKEYNARIVKELKVIGDKDFSDYFLVVADLVKWAKNNDITVGPGRGSAAGSLVCYLLGITEIDPLHPTFSRMVFERFIDPTRSDMPDIDLDFDDELRHLVPARAREIYGSENVCNVANHIKYRGKAALGGVARAWGMSPKVFDPIGTRCTIRVETDDRVDDSIKDVIESYQTDPEVQYLMGRFGDKIEQAMQLEGNQHSMGVHAGGFVIASDPIPNVCPIYTKNDTQVIPYEKRDAEYLNMLKVDFLGLTTMGMIGLCRKWTGMDLGDLYSLFYTLSDQAKDRLYESFRQDDCMGIFQYEGGTTRQVVRDVQPDNFDELAACGALSRPGPFYGGQTKEYIAVKRGEKDWERIHPEFDKHVEWTYGQIVYQEQIMWILRDLAGFDTARVLRVRKIIGKKLGEFQFVALWEEFKDGCIANGVSELHAAKVWSGITTAAGYAFNTAHAYSYALIAWWQMWFKINHPAEFFASNLYKNGDGKDDIPRRTALLKDAQAHEIEIATFDVTVMTDNWQVGEEVMHGCRQAIMPGFRQIPAVGENTAKAIVEFLAQNGSGGSDVQHWTDLQRVRGIGPNTVVAMVDFCCQPDPFGINKTEEQLNIFRKQCVAGEFAQFGLPDAGQFYMSSNLPQDNSYVAFVGLANNLVYRDEVESIRTRTGQSAEEIRAELTDPEKTKKATVFAYDEVGEVALRISRWRFDDLQTQLATIEKDHSIIVAYGRSFVDRPGSLQLQDIWVLEPE